MKKRDSKNQYKKKHFEDENSKSYLPDRQNDSLNYEYRDNCTRDEFNNSKSEIISFKQKIKNQNNNQRDQNSLNAKFNQIRDDKSQVFTSFQESQILNQQKDSNRHQNFQRYNDSKSFDINSKHPKNNYSSDSLRKEQERMELKIQNFNHSVNSAELNSEQRSISEISIQDQQKQDLIQNVKQEVQALIIDLKADFLSFDDVNLDKKKNQQQIDINNQIQVNYDRQTKYPWISDDTLKIKDVYAFLHNEILDFVKWIEQTPEQKQQRETLVKKIKNVVKESYSDAVIMVFGSCASGLNLPKSDIDLLVYNPDVKDLTMLNRLSNTLYKAGICKSIEALKHTKVPLIKLVDKKTGINLDISFNRTNGIYCVKLVKYLQKKYPELRPLILVLKSFLKSRKLNETYHGGVGSFLLTMMVTSYLQRQYKKSGTDKIDLGRHFIEFLNLYGNIFNYERVGISVRKEGSYFCKQKRGWIGQDERSRYRLSVENPQDPEVDIGKPAYAIKKVQRAFQHAYDTLVYNNQNSVSLLQLIINSDPMELLHNS